MKTGLAMLVSLCALIMAGCAGIESKPPLQTVASVDLVRYAGTWYEIARLPMWFQRHFIDSKAVYTTRPDGTIGVHNECVTDTGGLDQIDGIATVVYTKTNAAPAARREIRAPATIRAVGPPSNSRRSGSPHASL